ncbi:hypothetical protein CP8484711_2049, partial [Chlamydia psittaci 84-8471/1]
MFLPEKSWLLISLASVIQVPSELDRSADPPIREVI